MTTIKLFLSTIKSTLTNPGALAIFALIYALLVAAFFQFIWTREATFSQVFLTYFLMVLIPALFFILQAAIIDRVRDQRFNWRVILIDAVKFFVATIPILLIGWLIYYLLNKWQLRYPPPALTLPSAPGPPKPAPMHWPSLIFATMRFVLLGVALPLAAIHLWIALAGAEIRTLFAGGAAPFFNRIGGALARAFSADSVLIYAFGLILFFGVPYFFLFVPLTVKGNKTDFTVFTLRLLLTFVFSFIGWVVTISALARNYFAGAPIVSPDRTPAAQMEEAAA